MRGVREFHMPETLKACVLCGTPYGLSLQSFRFGARALDLPVCQACWKRHEASRVVLWAASAVSALAVAGGVALAVVTRGVAPALVGVAVAVASTAAALAFRRANRPKRAAGEGIVLDVPGNGRVRVG